MKIISLKFKENLVESSHVLATIAWTLIFAAALSTIFSGKSNSSSGSWNPNGTTSTASSTIPLPKDLFTGSLIFAVALTSALFSSWVIPECALALTDEVLKLSSDRDRELGETVSITTTPTPIINDPPKQPDRADINKQIEEEKTKMVKVLINLMFHLENRLLREAIATEQEALDKYIQILKGRRDQLGKDSENAAKLPREILNDTLQGENLLYVSNIDVAIAEQITKLQLNRDASLNGNQPSRPSQI